MKKSIAFCLTKIINKKNYILFLTIGNLHALNSNLIENKSSLEIRLDCNVNTIMINNTFTLSIFKYDTSELAIKYKKILFNLDNYKTDSSVIHSGENKIKLIIMD